MTLLPPFGSHISHIASAVWLSRFFERPEAHWMGLFAAYLDDSGTHDGARALVMCGFVTHMDQWLRFDTEWRQILAMPQFDLDYLHMKEMNSGKGKFQKFQGNLELQRDLYRRLQTLTKVRASNSFGSAVNLADYEKLNSEYTLREVIGSPYTVASCYAVREIRKWMERWHPDDDLLVVIDQGTVGWGEMCEQHLKMFGTAPIPGDSKKLPPLQAADHVAWENHRALTSGIATGFAPNSIKIRGSYAALIQRFGGDTWFLADEENLREAAERVNVPRR